MNDVETIQQARGWREFQCEHAADRPPSQLRTGAGMGLLSRQHHVRQSTGSGAGAVTHAHHWIIDSPAGPTSQGVCLTCNATKLFSNWHNEDKPSRERWTNGLKAMTEKRYTTKGDFVR